MTKNSFISQAVIWVGFPLMLLGLILDQLKVVFAIGYVTVLFGLIQRRLERPGKVGGLASAPVVQEKNPRVFVGHVAVDRHDVEAIAPE